MDIVSNRLDLPVALEFLLNGKVFGVLLFLLQLRLLL